MKTINFFLIICACLYLTACNSNDKPEVEDPVIEDPVIEDPVIEEPVIEDPVIEDPEVEEPEVEVPEIEESCPCLALLDASNSNDEPEVEEPVIEEPCPDLADINPHFAYGDIPNLAARLAYMGMERPADSYNYPLYPGMDEWATLSTSEMYAAMDVTPACLLRKMTTQAVIQAIWEHHNLGEVFWISSSIPLAFQSTVESQRSLYNAYGELYKRKDAGTALLERLTLVDPLTPFLRYESQVLELLLSRPEFLSQLNESEKRKTVEITLLHDEKRYAAWWDVGGSGNGLFTRPTAWILIGNTMYAACYCPLVEAMNENEELKYFIEGWRPNPYNPSKIDSYSYYESYYGNIPEIIIAYANDYINN